ncbi:MAG: hypothetical protein IT273_01745 [Chitinophagales bacterium]|nr:hypothetical protein [Chitinophagales bacterium]
MMAIIQTLNKRQKPRKGYFAAAGSAFYVLLLAGNVAIVGVLDLTWAQRYVVFCFSKILRSIFFEYSHSECRIVAICLLLSRIRRFSGKAKVWLMING